jgi:uncharacterized membrane protein
MIDERAGAGGPEGRALLAAGGVLLGVLGLKRSGVGGVLMASAGAALLYSGMRGPGTRHPGVSVKTAATIRRSRADVYALWRRIDELPRYMHHLIRVSRLDEVRSAWSFGVPGMDRRVEWIAEIVADEEGRRLAWSSLPGGDVITNGEVHFEDAPDGTRIRVEMEYLPGGGPAGRLAARALNPALQRLIRDDVRRVQSYLEAGEIPTVEGQPAAR